MTKFCAICEAEATHETAEHTPICESCNTAYEWGRAAFFALLPAAEQALTWLENIGATDDSLIAKPANFGLNDLRRAIWHK